MKKTFNIEIDCANCAIKCQEAVKKLDGVVDCQISFISQTMTIDSENLDSILKNVVKTIKRIEPDFALLD